GERLVAAMSLAKAAAIVDIGAGSGTLLPTLQAAAPQARMVGIDRTDRMLESARSGSPTTLLAVMNAQELGFRSATFDAAILAFVLFHFPDPVRGLSEAARVLRSGGVVGATTWGANHVPPASEIWSEELDAAGAGAETLPDSVQQHALMDTPGKLGDLLEAAGLAPARLWIERFERRWTWQDLFALRCGFGIFRRRLDTLAAASRRECLERIRDRLFRVSAAELLWQPEVVCAIATRS
ncbi:MAG: class I SAM-dependent methyltransferase, partial [Candidatus Rokuibacteriota bacterium]